MSGILRFPEAVKRSAAIDHWLKTRAPELGPMARAWFLRMRRCGDDVRELLHDGHPTACVGVAAFAYVNVFTAHVNVGFFYGAEFEDPTGLLEGIGKRGRHVKLIKNLTHRTVEEEARDPAPPRNEPWQISLP